MADYQEHDLNEAVNSFVYCQALDSNSHLKPSHVLKNLQLLKKSAKESWFVFCGVHKHYR